MKWKSRLFKQLSLFIKEVIAINLKVFESEEALDLAAAKDIAKVIGAKPHAKLGLATGHSPVGLYKKLVYLYEMKHVSFEHITSFNIDEYVGVGRDHPNSFYHFMKTHLFSKVNIPEAHTHIPDGKAADLEAEANRYEALLNHAGPLDVQILSVGLNGHIGFNEPESVLQTKTHVVPLTEETRQVNSKDFPSLADVPRHAITMGVGAMMRAKKIVFIAKGIEKAEILKRVFTGPIDTMVPGSLLQLHRNLDVYLDKDAAALLTSEE
ncbi:glucosamine-6-phosphate deaminase [Pullulanibacillus camelliae]|uniref:Glucosamine-6-phosphate deaminase n=1 Tax=Pullulanibacillus camelliae TaxID=1707096 RepID=A0A8J2VK29_9BACL|nr:glucosamine-6-phosphate deaminase [Pullulanibacillus camelliae]GGE27205.1 glucosamine-6-phosphate deaminase [Pullulanibacillus camelliae]